MSEDGKHIDDAELNDDLELAQASRPAPLSSWLKGGALAIIIAVMFIPMLLTRQSAENRALASLEAELKSEVQRIELADGSVGREIRLNQESVNSAAAWEKSLVRLQMTNVVAFTLRELEVGREHFEVWQKAVLLKQLNLIDCQIDYDAIGLLSQFPQLTEVNLTGSGVSPEMVFEMRQRSPELKVTPDLSEQ